MSRLMVPVNFEDLLALVESLTPEQKALLRERLDDEWSARFGKALDDIQVGIPAGVSGEEAQADVEKAIDESRSARV